MWGGAGSDHHDKIRASISERVHQHSTLSENWHARNKRTELIVVGMLPRAMGADGGITP